MKSKINTKITIEVHLYEDEVVNILDNLICINSMEIDEEQTTYIVDAISDNNNMIEKLKDDYLENGDVTNFTIELKQAIAMKKWCCEELMFDTKINNDIKREIGNSLPDLNTLLDLLV